MRYLTCLFLCLAACDTPSRDFWGVSPTHITVAGSSFDVRQNGLLAEAIRTNAEAHPEFRVIALKAEWAMEQVTGCAVREISGDVAMVFGALDCRPGADASTTASWKRAQSVNLICDISDAFAGVVSLDCD